MSRPNYARRIYFLQREDGARLIKIGCSAYPEGRRKQIQIDMKVAVRLLAETIKTDSGFEHERSLHRRFHASRVWGEWFRPTAELLTVIAQVAATQALPQGAEDDRRCDMARRYLAGETLRAIGDDFGISRERVRQILRADGVPSLGHRPEVARRGQFRRHHGESAAA